MRSPTLGKKESYALIYNLSTLLAAGIPIVEAVEGLMEESKGPMRQVLYVVRQSLNEGQTFSDAMSKMPRVFDPVTINLVRAAEEAGTLEKTLKDLAATLKRQIAFTDKLVSSLTYPGFVMVVFLGVLTFILVFVIPKLGRVFSGIGDVPATTTFMIAASDFILANYIFIIIGVIIMIAGLVALYKVKKRTVINALLSMPGLHRLGREIDLTNFSRSMGLLLSAGIPIAEALKFSQNVVVKKEVLAIVGMMRSSVDTGKPMSTDLRKHGKVIPSTTIRIIETAEASGSLETSMQELSEFFEARVTRTLKTLTTLLEPVMLVVMGVLVGGMMISVIAPIYNLVGGISQ